MKKPLLSPIYDVKGPPGGYIGALHCHTTASDGRKSLEELVEIYRDLGFSFLCVTDHQSAGPAFVSERDDFLIINGIEVAVRLPHGKVMHVVVLDQHDIKLGLMIGMRKLKKDIIRPGVVAFAAHPHWSDLTAADISGHGLSGMEIYNYGCRRETGKGNTVAYWDNLLSSGEPMFGFATDDTHGLDRLKDWGGGWVGVFCERLEKSSILNALISGNFYASMGPKIYDIQFKRDRLTFKTSPVTIARLVGRNGYATLKLIDESQIENGVVSVEFKLPPREELEGKRGYLRFECEDEETGRLAWTNPVFPPFPPRNRR